MNSNQIFLFVLITSAPIVVCLSWRWWWKSDHVMKAGWRGKLTLLALIFVSLSLVLFAFHLSGGVINWLSWDRKRFASFVGINFLLVACGLVTSVFARERLRWWIFAANFVVGYNWLMVAAWSWL